MLGSKHSSSLSLSPEARSRLLLLKTLAETWGPSHRCLGTEARGIASTAHSWLHSKGRWAWLLHLCLSCHLRVEGVLLSTDLHELLLSYVLVAALRAAIPHGHHVENFEHLIRVSLELLISPDVVEDAHL